jgi:hypothetical protein
LAIIPRWQPFSARPWNPAAVFSQSPRREEFSRKDQGYCRKSGACSYAPAAAAAAPARRSSGGICETSRPGNCSAPRVRASPQRGHRASAPVPSPRLSRFGLRGPTMAALTKPLRIASSGGISSATRSLRILHINPLKPVPICGGGNPPGGAACRASRSREASQSEFFDPFVVAP